MWRLSNAVAIGMLRLRRAVRFAHRPAALSMTRLGFEAGCGAAEAAPFQIFQSACAALKRALPRWCIARCCIRCGFFSGLPAKKQKMGAVSAGIDFRIPKGKRVSQPAPVSRRGFKPLIGDVCRRVPSRLSPDYPDGCFQREDLQLRPGREANSGDDAPVKMQ